MNVGLFVMLDIILGVMLPLTVAGLIYLEKVPTRYCLGPTWREIFEHVRRQRAVPRARAIRRRP